MYIMNDVYYAGEMQEGIKVVEAKPMTRLYPVLG